MSWLIVPLLLSSSIVLLLLSSSSIVLLLSYAMIAETFASSVFTAIGAALFTIVSPVHTRSSSNKGGGDNVGSFGRLSDIVPVCTGSSCCCNSQYRVSHGASFPVYPEVEGRRMGCSLVDYVVVPAVVIVFCCIYTYIHRCILLCTMMP